MKTSIRQAVVGVGAATSMVGIANVVLMVAQRSSGNGPSLGLLVVLVALILITAVLTSLALVLSYLEGRPYRELLMEATRRPEHSNALAQIIDADSRHEAIKSGHGLVDKDQGLLYRPDVAWPSGRVRTPPNNFRRDRVSR